MATDPDPEAPKKTGTAAFDAAKFWKTFQSTCERRGVRCFDGCRNAFTDLARAWQAASQKEQPDVVGVEEAAERHVESLHLASAAENATFREESALASDPVGSGPSVGREAERFAVRTDSKPIEFFFSDNGLETDVFAPSGLTLEDVFERNESAGREFIEDSFERIVARWTKSPPLAKIAMDAMERGDVFGRMVAEAERRPAFPVMPVQRAYVARYLFEPSRRERPCASGRRCAARLFLRHHVAGEGAPGIVLKEFYPPWEERMPRPGARRRCLACVLHDVSCCFYLKESGLARSKMEDPVMLAVVTRCFLPFCFLQNAPGEYCAKAMLRSYAGTAGTFHPFRRFLATDFYPVVAEDGRRGYSERPDLLSSERFLFYNLERPTRAVMPFRESYGADRRSSTWDSFAGAFAKENDNCKAAIALALSPDELLEEQLAEDDELGHRVSSAIVDNSAEAEFVSDVHPASAALMLRQHALRKIVLCRLPDDQRALAKGLLQNCEDSLDKMCRASDSDLDGIVEFGRARFRRRDLNSRKKTNEATKNSVFSEPLVPKVLSLPNPAESWANGGWKGAFEMGRARIEWSKALCHFDATLRYVWTLPPSVLEKIADATDGLSLLYGGWEGRRRLFEEWLRCVGRGQGCIVAAVALRIFASRAREEEGELSEEERYAVFCFQQSHFELARKIARKEDPSDTSICTADAGKERSIFCRFYPHFENALCEENLPDMAPLFRRVNFFRGKRRKSSFEDSILRAFPNKTTGKDSCGEGGCDDTEDRSKWHYAVASAFARGSYRHCKRRPSFGQTMEFDLTHFPRRDEDAFPKRHPHAWKAALAEFKLLALGHDPCLRLVLRHSHPNLPGYEFASFAAADMIRAELGERGTIDMAWVATGMCVGVFGRQVCRSPRCSFELHWRENSKALETAAIKKGFSLVVPKEFDEETRCAVWSVVCASPFSSRPSELHVKAAGVSDHGFEVLLGLYDAYKNRRPSAEFLAAMKTLDAGDYFLLNFYMRALAMRNSVNAFQHDPWITERIVEKTAVIYDAPSNPFWHTNNQYMLVVSPCCETMNTPVVGRDRSGKFRRANAYGRTILCGFDANLGTFLCRKRQDPAAKKRRRELGWEDPYDSDDAHLPPPGFRDKPNYNSMIQREARKATCISTPVICVRGDFFSVELVGSYKDQTGKGGGTEHAVHVTPCCGSRVVFSSENWFGYEYCCEKCQASEAHALPGALRCICCEGNINRSEWTLRWKRLPLLQTLTIEDDVFWMQERTFYFCRRCYGVARGCSDGRLSSLRRKAKLEIGF